MPRSRESGRTRRGPWDSYEVKTLELGEQGGAVVWTARHRTSQEGSGIELDMPMTALVEFRGDRIAEFRIFSTKEEALEAAGSRG